MRKIFFLILFVSTGIYAQDYIHYSQIIVKLKDNVKYNLNNEKNINCIGIKSIDDISRKYNVVDVRKIRVKDRELNILILAFSGSADIKKIISEYSKINEVEYSEPDYKVEAYGNDRITPNDNCYPVQWSLNNDGTFTQYKSITGADIDMERAWEITRGDSNIVVVIIDSGCKLDEPDFAGRIWINKDEIPDNSIDDDHNGFVDDYKGCHTVFSYNNYPWDDYGHGTNVASIIGATGNNGIGYAGIDWNCKLMIIKALTLDGVGYNSEISEAIYYAVDNGANVINMSLGSKEDATIVADAVKYAVSHNVVIVAAMGNENKDMKGYPAAYDGVIAVGATNSDDTRCEWNISYGSSSGSHISVVAPGNIIYGLTNTTNTNCNVSISGTSQATPHVTGIASLLLAQNPERTPLFIKKIIEKTAEDMVGDPSEDTPGWDKYYGFGRVNAFRALSESSFFNDIFVYPNPSNGKIKVLIPGTEEQLPIKVQITDITGKIVYSENFTSLACEINKQFQPGVYIVFIKLINKIYSGKIIVM
ncbi:MAG: S8 family serine peptidase [Bacteroidales bacterium]|nr:S8 family serine peptidase [Bacteroidales bacterium]